MQVAARSHISASSFRHLARSEDQALGLAKIKGQPWSPGPIDFWDLAATSVTMMGTAVVVCKGYLYPTIGIEGPNVAKLAMWGAFLATLGCPYILVADFNVTPMALPEDLCFWLLNCDHLCGSFCTPPPMTIPKRYLREILHAASDV